MSYHFSRAMVAAYWQANSSGGTSSAPSNSTGMPDKSCKPDKTTDASTHSPSGMTLPHLTESHGVEWWIASLAASRASESAQIGTIQLRAESQDCRTPKAASFPTSSESSEKLNPLLPDLRTTQISLGEGSNIFSKSLQRWGSMRSGELYRRTPLGLPMSENGCGLRLPTPTAHNAKEGGYPAEHKRNTKGLGAVFGGKPNPEYVEWMMGFPIGWTALSGPGTPRFQLWRQAHGI